MTTKLGPYFVPLFLNMPEVSQRERASISRQHIIAMYKRSGGRGFRQQPGTGSKRKHPRNPRMGDLEMILNGLQLVARYGAAHAQ